MFLIYMEISQCYYRDIFNNLNESYKNSKPYDTHDYFKNRRFGTSSKS